MKREACEIARRKLVFLEEQFRHLQTTVKCAFSEYGSTRDRQLVTERLSQLIIESAVDASEALLKGLGTTPPTNMWDVMREGQKEGMFDANLLQRFVASFLGYRNILVHAYEKIDNRQAFNTAKSLTRHMPAFIAQMRTYVDAQETMSSNDKAKKINKGK